MKYPVDFLEMVKFFEKTERYFHVLSNAVGAIFDSSDEFKPAFQPDQSDFSILGTQISFHASINDDNEVTNPINDYRNFSLHCSVWIFNDKFHAELKMFANRGSKETSFGTERTPLAGSIDLSGSNWTEIYEKLNSAFQKIVLGRPLLQFLLHDFYSEDRYEQFKTVAIKKLQEHSLEHMIQP